jgi:hypothetical protein
MNLPSSEWIIAAIVVLVLIVCYLYTKDGFFTSAVLIGSPSGQIYYNQFTTKDAAMGACALDSRCSAVGLKTRNGTVQFDQDGVPTPVGANFYNLYTKSNSALVQEWPAPPYQPPVAPLSDVIGTLVL